MADSAVRKPVPAASDLLAVTSRANEPSADAQAGRPLQAAGGPRPSQVPVPGRTARLPAPASTAARHGRQRLRPSGAWAGAASVPARPSAAPARPITEVLRSGGVDKHAPGHGPESEALLARMERAFAADFADVRVHQNSPRAARLGAEAYTQGNEIHVAPGLWAPQTRRGQALLGHELAHVVQQREGRVPRRRGSPALDATPALEQEAEARGTAAAQGTRLPGTAPAGVTAGRAHVARTVLQCRLPPPSKEELAANLQGIQNLLVRVYYHDLNEQQRGAFDQKLLESHVDLGKALGGKPGEHTQHLYYWVLEEFPNLIYSGPGETGPQPNELEAYNALTGHTLDVLNRMQMDKVNLTEVFGEEGMRTAQERVAAAREAFRELVDKGRILADKSGEQREMMASGHSKHRGDILLRGAASFQNNVDNVATLVHETMHHTYADILDGGGYPTSAKDFRERPMRVKLDNAAHYEEVARRILGQGALGGEFKPVVQENEKQEFIDDRTPAQKAQEGMATKVRQAWEAAQNVHGLFKWQVQNDANPYRQQEVMQHWGPLGKWSEILGLEAHTRKPRADSPSPINFVDLLQVESIAKVMGQMYERSSDVPGELDDQDAMLSYLIKQSADDRWLTTDRLKYMIKILADHHRDPTQVK
jgi:hypothetical protein